MGGKEYGEAIGLPRPSWAGWLVGIGRIYALKTALLVYWLPGASRVLEPLSRRLFASMVVGIRQKQPDCRFGAHAIASIEKDQAGSNVKSFDMKKVCPLGFGGDVTCACACRPRAPTNEEMARMTSRMMPTII